MIDSIANSLDMNIPQSTAKTKTECAEKLEALKEKYGKPTEKINSEMPFGEWIDFWYQTYCKHTRVLPTGKEPLKEMTSRSAKFLKGAPN